MKETKVGILGLGMYLPPEVRRNDWWPAEVVERWMDGRRLAPRPPLPDTIGEGGRRALQGMLGHAHDPFQGAVERRVLPSDMSVFDMEEHAARQALERAGVEPGAIDLLLTFTVVPDYLVGNPACILHHRLGLPASCFTMQTDASSFAFMMQLTLADAMIRAGRARRALIVQSCAPSRLLPVNDPLAPVFGDLATAAVVGPVAGGRGIEAAVAYADGRNPRNLILSVPGGTWYDEGRAVLHVADAQQARAVFLESIDSFKHSVENALASASHAAADVDFFCVHQGSAWMRAVVQEYLGLEAARSVETFARIGYVFASTLPAALAFAQEQGKLVDDDIVALVAGGPGTTYGATIIRWGV